MSAENLMATIEAVTVPDEYCVTVGELRAIRAAAEPGCGTYEAMLSCFYLGFQRGQQAAKGAGNCEDHH